MTDTRLTAALREQLAQRERLLHAGARHVGWKLGIGDRERIGDSPLAVGHLTTATLHDDGARAGLPSGDLHADVEIAVELAGPDAIAGCRAALELVDLAPVLDSAVAVVATNIFHRAVAFGPPSPHLPVGAEGVAIVGGERRAAAPVPDDIERRLRDAARVLASAGCALAAGDRVITGSIVQVPVAPGDRVTAAVSGLGAVTLTV